MPAISVQNLGKRYRVNHAAKSHGRYRTLRDTLADAATAPLRRFRNGGVTGTTEDFWALKDVNFEIQPGEVVGIIGRNGAGKSTLLKVLSRITAPSRGEIGIRGRIGSLLEVGTGFHPELSGRENIYLNGAILGMNQGEISRQFDAIVSFSGVERFLDTPVKRYSSGMIVRLAFAVAAHLEPEILIIDEVLAVGDSEFQRKCMGKMGDVARSGRTILFVSHNMAAVESLCQRGIVMEGGQVEFDGVSHEAVRRYHHRTRQSLSACFESNPDDDRRPVRITRAEVRLVEEESQRDSLTGLALEISVECDSEIPLDRPALGIGIDRGHGERVVTFHTSFDREFESGPVEGRFRFRCRANDLALVPGQYSVKLSLESGRTSHHVLDPAMIFPVAPYDFYGMGGKNGRGVIYCRHNWSLEQ